MRCGTCNIVTIFMICIAYPALLINAEEQEVDNNYEEYDEDYPNYYNEDYDYDEEYNEEEEASGNLTSNAEDEYPDYSYSYQDYKDFNESEIAVIPEMKSLPQSFTIAKGGTARFPCVASDSTQLVRIWQRDDGNVIFTGAVKVSRQENHQLDNTTLVISDAQPHDAGGYTCRVMIRARDELSVTHRLIVNTQSFHISTDPPEGQLVLEEGRDAALKCVLQGEDVPENTDGSIRWNREGNSRFRDGAYTLNGDLELLLENVTTDDAGKYFCTATSTNGETKSTHLEVIVQFRPAIISLTKSSYKTGRGLAGELTCLINGEPEPKVTWYKGNEVVHLDDRITSEHAGNRHILLISRLRADDVATYMCYTINELGSAQKTVQIQHEDITEQSVFSASTENTIASTAEQETIIEEVDKDQDETGIPVESENHWNNMEFLESFKQKIESDINTLRNLTYRAISQSQSNAGSNSARGSASSTNNIEDSIFVDLQRLQLQLRQFQSLSEGHMKEMNDFQRVAKDDFQRLWDNVNELQEIANVTTKNMEDIYDKDILPLQNFKTATENDMNKLREEMDDFLSLKESSSSQYEGGNASEEAIRILNKSNRKMEMLEDEQQRQKVQLEKLQESQTLTRTEIQRIFEDIDGFKKKSQALTTDQLKLERELQRIENVRIMDLSNALNVHDRNLEDFGLFREKSVEDLAKVQTATDQNFAAMAKEMQTVKSQIYYLQQSVLQLRGALQNTDESSSSVSQTSLTASLPNSQMDKLESQIEQCAAKNDIVALNDVFTSKTDEFTDIMSNLHDQIKTLDRQVNEGGEFIKAVKKNTGRIEVMEARERRKNLIIKGLRQERRLERPNHLEGILKRFFKQTLNVTAAKFEEAMRLKPKEAGDVVNNGAPIKVRFPSVREKLKVLQASRNVTRILKERRITILEDFTDQVLRHRQALASFARRRARKTKKKWALKYDELYFNGRVFVFDEDSNRVEAA